MAILSCYWVHMGVLLGAHFATAAWLAQLVERQSAVREVLSKRVGGVVPGVVVYLLFHCTFHAWAGWVSEIKYGLIAAARGAFTS